MLQNISLGLILLLSSLSLFANPPKEQTSSITSVTVFPQNAKVTRETKLKLQQGESEVLLTGISSKFVLNSVQVKLVGGQSSIVSVTPRINYLKEQETTQRAKELQDSMELLSEDLALLNIKIEGVTARRSVLTDNNPLGSAKEQGFSIEQMQRFMDFRQKNLVELNTQLYKLNETKTKLSRGISRLQRALQSINGKAKVPTGEVLLKVKSKQAATVDVVLSFIVQDAGWTPIYDLRAESIEKPVELHYKAHVRQNTGYDWNKVQLLLSTNNPNQGNERPILSPNYLNLMDTYRARVQRGRASAPAPSANSNSYAGYRNAELKDFGEATTPGTVATPSSFEFLLDNKQSIPSDNQQHLVQIDQHELPAVYEYHTVPKVDKGAFLLAKVTDYGQYKLLPGKANIFFEGTYIGESSIDPQITTDTMPLSLGRDERIVVKRERVKDLTSKKVIGFNKKEELVYEISIRNNKSEAISIELLDHIPISNNNDLEVTLLEAKGGDFLEKYGSIRWRMSIEPNETKKIRFSFSLKYPKGKIVSGGY